MEIRCCLEGCLGEFEYLCKSCRIGNVFCSTHAEEHIKRRSDHTVSKYLVNINKEMIKSWESNILNYLAALNSHKKEILSSVSKILKEVYEESQKTLNIIKNIETNLLETLKKTRELPLKTLKTDFSVLSELDLKLPSPSNPKGIKEQFQTYQNSILDSSIKLYEHIYKSEFLSDRLVQLESSKSSYKLERTKDLLETTTVKIENSIIVFYPDGSNINKVNVNSLEKIKLNFKNVRCNQGASSVKYEENKWFYCYNGDAYLLDLLNEQATAVKRGFQKYYLRGCVVYFGYILMFGGVGGEYGEILVREAESYSIMKDSWERLAHLPSIFKSTCAKVIDNKIFIIGYESQALLAYNPTTNSYSTQGDLLNGQRCKIFCGRFVLVNRSNILFHISNDTVTQISLKDKISCDMLSINYVFENEKFAYFVTLDKCLMRFNLDTFQLDTLCENL